MIVPPSWVLPLLGDPNPRHAHRLNGLTPQARAARGGLRKNRSTIKQGVGKVKLKPRRKSR